MADQNNNQSIGDQIRGIVEDAVKGAVSGVGNGIRSFFSGVPEHPEIIDEPKTPPKNLSEVDQGNVAHDYGNAQSSSVPTYVKTKFRPPQLYKNANAELSSGSRETVGGGIMMGVGGTVAFGNILASLCQTGNLQIVEQSGVLLTVLVNANDGLATLRTN